MSKRIGIFIVAYNAATTIAKVLERIPDDIVAKVEEIFVFDDCSQDNTYEIGRSYADGAAAAKLTIHRNPVNLMYGGNQKRGYTYAIERGLDIVVLLHGDGQYAPEVMQRLLGPLERGEAQLVMGSRMLEPGAALYGRMPLYKYIGNRILTTIQNWLLGTHFSEFHSGYRAYTCKALRTIDFDRLTSSWHFDTQIILEFLRRGYTITEVPIPTYYGDEICRVNGIAYAYQCVKATALFAWQQCWKRLFALRASQRTTK
jgi:glycosyltransferase involved in cell wall biosynthesis